MSSVKKTNAVRILENEGIPFELIEYEVDGGSLSAEDAALKTGVPEEQTFKTLCVRGDRNGVMLVCVPAGKELDFKALSSASGNKRSELVHLREVLPLTGYTRGGCSPVGVRRKYPVYVDESMIEFDFITVNAGQRGLLFKIKPGDLILATLAKVANIVK